MQSIANLPLGPRLGKLPHLVKGNSSNDISHGLGSIPQMEITRQTQLDLIDDGIKRLGTNQHALERAAGVPVGTIKDLRRGKRAMVSDRWQKILNALKEPRSKETALPEPTVALLDVLKAVFALLIDKELANEAEILAILEDQQQSYDALGQKGSLEVIRLLQESVIGRAVLTDIQRIQQTLRRARGQSDAS